MVQCSSVFGGGGGGGDPLDILPTKAKRRQPVFQTYISSYVISYSLCKAVVSFLNYTVAQKAGILFVFTSFHEMHCVNMVLTFQNYTDQSLWLLGFI